MPILVLYLEEASYHGARDYDHCTVRYLQQAGVKPSYIKLADIGIHGNSHVMMLEKNNQEIAAVIATVASTRRSTGSIEERSSWTALEQPSAAKESDDNEKEPPADLPASRATVWSRIVRCSSHHADCQWLNLLGLGPSADYMQCRK